MEVVTTSVIVGKTKDQQYDSRIRDRFAERKIQDKIKTQNPRNDK